MAYAKPSSTLPLDYERLYALGIDAWRLTQLLLKTERARDIAPLDGVTGKLTLDGAQFVRTLTSVEMRDGMPFVFKPAD
jgi:outer membrane PBP1 activator LpoA protein